MFVSFGFPLDVTLANAGVQGVNRERSLAILSTFPFVACEKRTATYASFLWIPAFARMTVCSIH